MERLKEDMLNTFSNAQIASRTDASVDEILHRLKKLYKKQQFNEYFESLFEISVSILRCPEANPNTKRLLEFLATILQKFAKEESLYSNSNKCQNVQPDDNEDDLVVFEDSVFETDKLVLRFSEFTRDSSVDVRVNTCRLLKNIFESFEEIDQTIYNQVQENLGFTSTDKEARVRANGILALAAISEEENNTVHKKKQFMAKYDPEVTVRVCAFRTLLVRKDNLPILLSGIHDSSIAVQKLCFMRIFRDFDLEWLSREQIFMTFRTAFYSTHSKQLLTSHIPRLISQKDDGLVHLVSLFNLRNDCDFIYELLRDFYKEYHKKQGIFSLVKNFKDIYFDEKVIPKTPDMARHVIVVWESLVEFCKEHNIVLTQETEDDSQGVEVLQLDLCDALMPDLANFLQFFRSFIDYHLQKSHNIAFDQSYIEDLNGCLDSMLRICDYYSIPEHSRLMVFDFFKKIVLRYDVFILYRKYLIFFIPHMFKHFKVEDTKNAFEIIKEIISEIQKRAHKSQKDNEELMISERKMIQWTTSIFAGFTKCEFLLLLKADSEILRNILEYGVRIIEAAVNDFSRDSLFEVLCIIGAFIFFNPRIWSQLAQLVYHLLSGETKLSELNVMALEIFLDVSCLLPLTQLELHHVYDDSDQLDESESFESQEKQTEIWFETFLMVFLEYEPKKNDKKPPNAVRHMDFGYRLFRLAIIGMCRHMIVRKFSSTHWYSRILTIYLDNPLIDDKLYRYIGNFIDSITIELPAHVQQTQRSPLS